MEVIKNSEDVCVCVRGNVGMRPRVSVSMRLHVCVRACVRLSVCV